MRFTVIWKKTAENKLADIWLSSANRQAVTAAAYRIEHALRDDPQEKGESRSNGRRVLLETPLGVDFRVDELDR